MTFRRGGLLLKVFIIAYKARARGQYIKRMYLELYLCLTIIIDLSSISSAIGIPFPRPTLCVRGFHLQNL